MSTSTGTNAGTHPSYPLAAYTERDSIDPLTCEEGKLRREWAVVPTAHFDGPLCLLQQRQFNPRDWDEWAVIVRTIRRGAVEPWAILDFHPTEEAGLQGILDSPIIPAHPRLVAIHREREHAQRVEEARRAAESEKARERERTRALRLAGSKAFEKLQRTGKPADLALCTRWNAFVLSPASEARRDLYAADPVFMERYYAALYADRMPAKRKAMREFFAYVEAHYPGALDDIESTPNTSNLTEKEQPR